MPVREKFGDLIIVRGLFLSLVFCLSSCSATGLTTADTPEQPISDVKVCNALTNFMSARNDASDAETAAKNMSEIAESVAVLARESISKNLKDALLDYNQATKEALYEYEYEGKASVEALTRLALVSEDVIAVCSEAVMSDINE